MDNNLKIETLHSQLIVLSRDTKYDFESLRCDWGKNNSREYGFFLSRFRRSMRMLAADCPVRWYRGNFYMFNGKVYEVTEQDVIEMAYMQLLEDMAISAVLTRGSFMCDLFMKTIRLCNMLVPHFDIVAFNNGVVDFGTNLTEPAVMPFSPEYHVTYYHPYDFDPKDKCPRWLNFLH